ncbi:endoglucanase-like [Macrosteles quadrilineatus]|uniref:endoglucanase-like n=1 Tax=Macrosteles quadrilineatus TaxID=74068 RepID=UPI0023E2575D|nr:endoglucanase-like [Macrosteles quadrilineatus]
MLAIFWLLVTVGSALAGSDDEAAKKLLKQTPEVPAIPTKNGQYIFVPNPNSSGSSHSPSSSNPSNPTSSSTSPVVAGGKTKSCKNQLKGVNRSGFEYSCVKDLGISEGPLDDNAVNTMKSWNINAVRIPLNEDCWLGLNNFKAEYTGDKYRNAVINYVKRLRQNNIKVVLDLHWTDGIYKGDGQGECVDERAKCQKPMPDRLNAPTFWKSVANEFKNDNGVIFDLFNEPFPEKVMNDKSKAWQCWRDGGNACTGFAYEVAGMQELVNAVRSTGAKNLVMVGGIAWANDLSQWLTYKPNDEANNMAAAWHSYDHNACNNQNCWESTVAPIAEQYPVIVGEIGEHGCTHNYIDKLLKWLDSKNINYIAWVWNTWDCSSGPALIQDYNGTPTNFGVGYKEHLSKSTCNA